MKNMLCCQDISSSRVITIGPTTGWETIAKARGVFPGWIDPDFVVYGTDVPSQPTKEKRVRVLEITNDGKLPQILRSLIKNRNHQCLTQSQIICFVKNYEKWLPANSSGTLFMLKVKIKGKNRFFVVRVYRHEGAFRVEVHRPSRLRSIWDVNRVIVP